MVLMDSFQEYSQGDKTPNQHETNPCGLFAQFDAVSNPLSKSFQVMSIVHGIHEEYSDLIHSLCDGQQKILEQDLGDITAWCNGWDNAAFKKGPVPKEVSSHCKSR